MSPCWWPSRSRSSRCRCPGGSAAPQSADLNQRVISAGCPRCSPSTCCTGRNPARRATSSLGPFPSTVTRATWLQPFANTHSASAFVAAVRGAASPATRQQRVEDLGCLTLQVPEATRPEPMVVLVQDDVPLRYPLLRTALMLTDTRTSRGLVHAVRVERPPHDVGVLRELLLEAPVVIAPDGAEVERTRLEQFGWHLPGGPRRHNAPLCRAKSTAFAAPLMVTTAAPAHAERGQPQERHRQRQRDRQGTRRCHPRGVLRRRRPGRRCSQPPDPTGSVHTHRHREVELSEAASETGSRRPLHSEPARDRPTSVCSPMWWIW